MSWEEILNAIRELGLSQGHYQRLYNEIMTAQKEDVEMYNAIKQMLVEQKFKDTVDMVLFLEE